MISIPLHIDEIDDFEFVSERQKNYSFAFRKLYAVFGNKNKKDATEFIQEKFNLNDIEARSLYSDVQMKVSQTITNNENKLADIKEIEKEIKKLSKKKDKTKKENRVFFGLRKKLAAKQDSISRDITFGSKKILKRLGYLSNCKGETIEQDDGTEIVVDKELIKIKKEYDEQRILSVFLIGESNQKGNRFFDFDFSNRTITYKYNKNKHIKIVYRTNRRYQNTLEQLKYFIDNKTIAISVRMDIKKIVLTFDDSILSGNHIDEVKLKKGVAELKKSVPLGDDLTAKIKSLYRKAYLDLETKNLVGRKSNRLLCVDKNPNYIGCTIIDFFPDKKFKIIHAWFYDLTQLNKKGTSAEKRKYGICNMWKDVFATFAYYKCGYFVVEKLNIPFNEIVNDKSKEANRQIKNIWNRELTDKIITKYINKYAINKNEINAAYTSTVGNVLHPYNDPVNAAIALGVRRACQSFQDGFFPDYYDNIPHAMNRIAALNKSSKKSGDVDGLKNCKSWKELHIYLKRTGLRYRVSLNDMCSIDTGFAFMQSRKLKHIKIKKIIFI